MNTSKLGLAALAQLTRRATTTPGALRARTSMAPLTSAAQILRRWGDVALGQLIQRSPSLASRVRRTTKPDTGDSHRDADVESTSGGAEQAREASGSAPLAGVRLQRAEAAMGLPTGLRRDPEQRRPRRVPRAGGAHGQTALRGGAEIPGERFGAPLFGWLCKSALLA
eukprot:scaffold1667_cov258-Pinguiococcus_pyrenoidosus.AAC.24